MMIFLFILWTCGKVKVTPSLSFAYEVVGYECRVTKYPHGRGQGHFPALLEHTHT